VTERYFLGFDGGGTKTQAALLDPTGACVALGHAGPSNPLRAGFEAAQAALDAAAQEALDAARIPRTSVQGVCAGVAGAGRARVVKRIMAHLVEQFPAADVHVTTDAEVALEAAAGPRAGVVLISGTGSICLGRDATGRMARAGGYGPWIGDEGSAFDIGRRAVVAVARARDALGPVTILSDLIPPALELPNWEKLAERIAEAPDEIFPRLFPVVLEAAAADDNCARDILFRAALGLARITSSVVRHLDLAQWEFPLALSGGVFGRLEFFDQIVHSTLAGVAPRAHIERLTERPAVGAARLAIRLFAPVAEQVAHGAPG
jgi:N-acetylglucosamine kinase-like BadF-type ATPase